MARWISLSIVLLAALGVASLAVLPVLAERAAGGVETRPPATLSWQDSGSRDEPEPRDEPVATVEELNEALRLPKVEESVTDEHSRISLRAYREEDYRKAFEESILALDPAPLEENGLYRVLTSDDQRLLAEGVDKPNGRRAIRAVDAALSTASQDDGSRSAHLNNAAAMMVLYYNTPGTEVDGYMGWWLARELAYQAADSREAYCPALLNLTLLEAAPNTVVENLQPAGDSGDTWTNHYPAESCEDPALLYYRSQYAISPAPEYQLGGREMELALDEGLRLADRLASRPGWDGLAHSVRGDGYYWHGIYSEQRTVRKKSYAARRYFELALWEYEAALKLQPDDPAIHHGKALAYLALGKTGKAIEAGEKALKATPDSVRIAQTLVDAYADNGDHEAAARTSRDLLSEQRRAQTSTTIAPFSAISHGAESYSELRLGGQGGAALFDDTEIVKPFVHRAYGQEVFGLARFGASFAGQLDGAREELIHYSLLRDDFLSGDFESFEEDLDHAPGEVRSDWHTSVLISLAEMREPSKGSYTLTPKSRQAIDDFAATYEAGEPPREIDTFFTEAGNFLRQQGRYGEAVRIYELWRADLDRTGADKSRRSHVEYLTGEALFLQKQKEEALAAFERAAELRPDWPPYTLRQAFMHERLMNYNEAQRLYGRALETMRRPAGWTEGYDPLESFYAPDNYLAAKHLGDVLLRRARNYEATQGEGENVDTIRAKYEEAAGAYREALTQAGLRDDTVETTAAANNLGIALIKAERYGEATEILDGLVDPSAGAPASWKLPPTPDEHNPIFRLNLGWAYELNDQPEKAKRQYLAALESDPTFYPALNDLGVLAAREGRLEEAKGYFEAAIRATKGNYDYALYNLGVALLRSGPENFLAAQDYLARAVRENPSFDETSYDYAFDNELYFLNLSLGTGLPPDWRFAAHAERSTFFVSAGAVLLLLFGIVRRTAMAKGRDTVIGRAFDEARSRLGGRVSVLLSTVGRGWLRLNRIGQSGAEKAWLTPLALLVSAPAVAVVQGWPLLREDSAVKLLMIAILIYVALVSLLVHHAGHALAALVYRARVSEAPWPSGIAQALLLAVVSGPFVAPMPATSVAGAARDRERELIYLAGPLASIAFAVFLYALFQVSDVPLFSFGVVLNLGLAAASLLTVPPLEGASISEGYYTRWTFGATILVTIMSALLATGAL